MKKIKAFAALILALMLILSTVAVSAATPTATSTDLVVTKYQIAQMNGETDRIGLDYLQGTENETPTEGKVFAGVEFTAYKLDEMGTYVTLNDVVYNAADKTVTYDGKKITGTSKVTDANGQATFTVNKADFGVYYVVETNAPDYVTATSAPFIVELPRTNAEGTGFMENVYVFPKNYTTLGGSILEKVDSSANKALAGAEFKLFTKDGVEVTKDALGQTIGTLTTGSDGIIFVNNLKVGEYYFQETKAPAGYMLKSDKYTFAIESGKSTEVIKNADGTYTYTGISKLTADNSSQPQVEKYVTTVGNKIQNTAFDAQAKWIIISDVPSDMGVTTYTNYTITDTMDAELSFFPNTVKVYKTTDGTNFTEMKEGFTVSTVDADSFTVNFTDFAALKGAKEVKVEYMTVLNKETTVMGDEIYNNVELFYATDATSGFDKEDNPPYVYTGGFKFTKIDTEGKTLADAEFKVVDANGETVIEKVVSDSKGLIDVKGLLDGDYKLIETKAPKGFELLTKEFNFTVTKTSYNNAQNVTITNIPVSKLPVTGGMGTTIFVVVGVTLIAGAGVLFVLSRKSKKDN